MYLKDWKVPEKINKFGPKLTFADMCAWYAINKHVKTPPGIIAKAAGVHPVTISKMLSPTDKSYPRVKRQAHSMGIPRMFETYVTNEHMESIHKVIRNFNDIQIKKLEEPSAKLNKHAGTLRRTDSDGNSVIFEILWYEGEHGPGWYYTDSRFPGESLISHEQGKPWATSYEARKWLESGAGDF